MYSKVIEVRYFPGTDEAAVIIDGVPSKLRRTLVDALKEAKAEFSREVIRHERANVNSKSSR